jgi:hypothetical protein
VRPGTFQVVSSIRRERGDAVDLDELVLIAEGSDAEQRARWAVRQQSLRDSSPHDRELCLISNDVDGRAHEVVERRTRARESSDEIADALVGLRDRIICAHDLAGLVERAGAGREDKRAWFHHRRIFVRDSSEQLAVLVRLVDHDMSLPQARCRTFCLVDQTLADPSAARLA